MKSYWKDACSRGGGGRVRPVIKVLVLSCTICCGCLGLEQGCLLASLARTSGPRAKMCNLLPVFYGIV